MTPEQDENWKAAIMPVALGVVEGYELTEKGLRESLRRLTDRGVSPWAAQLRIALLFRAFEPWHPNFALRSETALVGIQLLPYENRAVIVYERAFLRFACEVLRPLIDYARQTDDYRRAGYKPLIELFERCERFTPPGNVHQWPEAKELFPPRGFHYGMPETIEVYHAGNMGTELLRAIRAVFDPPGLTDWRRFISLIDNLNQMYQWLQDGKVGVNFSTGPSYREAIADAYLIALEAECPAPEWLPRE